MEFDFINRRKDANNTNSVLASIKSNYQHSYRDNAINDGPNIVSGTATRKAVAKQGTNEFVAPVSRRTTRTSPAPAPSYSSGARKKKKVRASSSSTSSLKSMPLSKKIYWGVLCLMFLRLVFMDNGLIDYINMERTLKHKQQEYLSITKENHDLVEEINLIKTNRPYQKKIARDHLGVIAPDEYLVLFARENTAAN